MNQNISSEDLILWQQATADVMPLNMTPDVTTSQPSIARSYPASGQLANTHDLHGLTIEGAYRYMVELLDHITTQQTIRVITGKSGQIRREFVSWMETPRFASKVRRVYLESTGGSFTILLK